MKPQIRRDERAERTLDAHRTVQYSDQRTRVEERRGEYLRECFEALVARYAAEELQRDRRRDDQQAECEDHERAELLDRPEDLKRASAVQHTVHTSTVFTRAVLHTVHYSTRALESLRRKQRTK